MHKTIFKKTIQLLKEKQVLPLPKEQIIINEKRDGKIFFISDLHFDHANIIRYCNRPFKSKEEMNRAIIKNWNSTVKDKDSVYILGDVAFGRGHRSIDFWLKKLKGHMEY